MESVYKKNNFPINDNINLQRKSVRSKIKIIKKNNIHTDHKNKCWLFLGC